MNWKAKLLQIWNSRINPFGNYDDPIPPKWCFEKYGKFAWFYWFFVRNPLHNFSFYWIGTADKPAEWRVWHSKRKWNLILPFFSYRGKWIEFYIGARPRDNGGQAWGIAFRIRKENE